MTQNNTPRDDETLFTPVARTVINTVDSTIDVKNFVCKATDFSIKKVSTFAVDNINSPKSQMTQQRISDTFNKNPILSIAFSTVLPIVLFSGSKTFRAIPLSLIGLGLSLKHFYPENISDYTKISIDHYNRLRERLSEENNNN
ncbi:hypothetical protein DICPUDRAFT_74029 [Dictyostelium purpureum]|uniref:MICOS complex subunit n=1 Tax=Dictyostelium purpureum TaxID=5786 RepID=F0Z6K0_DICPU|nr:uncharacterized protein DICPUDRAFT_74029 [Dictyostelium purpureum]EGC40505.1 hypothetical protein DICPUDRAFT_74029 [Dictyostelium purpureum]|eukprot:XP_003283052.1 hypothetical protein DICPUDRAFT_74029 [Dictyostelium purpureum]